MMTEPHPPVVRDLRSGEALLIGARQFEVIAAAGHSDGQLALYCRDERLLLCGDAVLMKITPNVGLWPWGDQNPLATFLATLERLAGLQVDLALPGHGPLIDGFHARIGQLRGHHDERIEQMRLAVGGGADAYHVCRRVFATETLTSHQLRFAMAETLAHLEYLVAIGGLRREEIGERLWYR
jgi:glyoxylase-like metal-dependent hydrolase (beta-lactamase superfamily II)